MASFVIHTIVGERFLNELEKKYNITISDYDRKLFLLGNLIPDSLKLDRTIPDNLSPEDITKYKIDLKRRIREEKRTTHFRNPSTENLCLKIPSIQLFLSKYENLVKRDMTSLGYMFHLYTDRLFFSELFPKTFTNLDSSGNETIYDSESTTIHIKKTNEEVDSKDFWAGTCHLSIYDDYTTMNKILLAEFGTSFDEETFLAFAQDNFNNPGIEEVSYNQILELISKTSDFIKESYSLLNRLLQVFRESDIKDFIVETPEKFMIEYSSILEHFKEVKKNKKGE